MHELRSDLCSLHILNSSFNMKIALVTHNVVRGDGQGRVNYELVHHLLLRGHDVDLIADRVAPDLVEAGATWHPLHPGFEEINLLKVWRFKHQANALLKKIGDQFDAVLACGVTLSCPHTVNVAHFVHGTWLHSPYHSFRVRRLGVRSLYHRTFTAANARWERDTFAQAQSVVAVSEMVKQELIDIGVSSERITVIVNGVDCDEFAPGPVSRTDLGLPEGPVLGLFAGDITSPIKNLDTLLRAMVDVPALHLAVAGTLDQSPYPALARELGIDDRVHFLGFRRDIADLMRGVDFFALPSRRDSCPLVLLEALASGLPVVTACTVGNANLVEDDAGFIIPSPDDVDALTEALGRLASDPALRARMSRAARQVAEANSWSEMGDAYIRLFEEETRTSSPSPMVAA
jgi:glycosyltransferase involved in cell wall biosynthesis